MDDLPRLIISNDRLKSATKNNLKLTIKESHYLNKVMRLNLGQEIFVVNGQGLMWKGKKIQDNIISLPPYEKPFISQARKNLLLGLAIAIPKKGFEDVIKMSTEIGIDFIRPLYTERQIKKISNIDTKSLRWDAIVNESLEQCERLWKPQIQSCIGISEWLESIIDKDHISISITREENCMNLKEWLNHGHFNSGSSMNTLWNVIGPEGGWSQNERMIFNNYKIKPVCLSENILRTSTAAINASVILTQWRDSNSKILLN